MGNKNNDNDSSIDFSLDELDLEPNEFLDIKKGDQLKNVKRLKKLLHEIDTSLDTIENESYSIAFFLELLLDKDPSVSEFSGDDDDAMDIINKISEKISNLNDLVEDIKNIKGDL